MLLFTMTAGAQILNVHKTDGTMYSIPTDEIDYINFIPRDSVRRIHVEVGIADEATTTRIGQRRAPVTTKSTLTSFSMHGVYSGIYNYEASRATEEYPWILNRDTWPDEVSDKTPVPFYAHDGGNFNNVTDPYIRFTIAEDAPNQHDLLVASDTVAYAGTNDVGVVPLIFDHACAAVNFNVLMSNKLATDPAWGGKTLTVNSIILRNVYWDGKYYFNNPHWDIVTGSGFAYYTLTNGDITVTTVEQALPSNSLFIIPQNRTASDSLNTTTDMYLEVNYTVTGNDPASVNIPLSVNWVQGRQYTINIKLGTTLIKYQ